MTITRIALALAATCLFVTASQAQPGGHGSLAQRIGHYMGDKATFHPGVHAGPGSMNYDPLLDETALSTNLIFVHRGRLNPHSGIGEHFHNRTEEMFVIFSGEAQFTINGHTALLKAPAAAPDRMGAAHAIYNPTDKPIEFMNINVGLSKVYDAFNLEDGRVGAPLEPIPQFMTIHMDRALLKPVEHMRGGNGTVYINRNLKAGDTYQLPNATGLTLSPTNAGAVEMDLDGQAIGVAGGVDQSAEAVPLDPQAIVDRFKR